MRFGKLTISRMFSLTKRGTRFALHARISSSSFPLHGTESELATAELNKSSIQQPYAQPPSCLIPPNILTTSVSKASHRFVTKVCFESYERHRFIPSSLKYFISICERVRHRDIFPCRQCDKNAQLQTIAFALASLSKKSEFKL